MEDVKEGDLRYVQRVTGLSVEPLKREISRETIGQLLQHAWVVLSEGKVALSVTEPAPFQRWYQCLNVVHTVMERDLNNVPLAME